MNISASHTHAGFGIHPGLVCCTPGMHCWCNQASTTNRYETMWPWQLQGIMVNLEKTGQLVHVSHLEPVPY